MMRFAFAWMVLAAGVCYGGEEASVLVSPTPAAAVVVAPAPVVVAATPVVVGCNNGKCDPVYTAKTDERSSCRRSVFGRVVRRDVKRTVLSPVR